MEVFHRDEVLALGFPDVVHLHDVLVMQVRGDPRLVEEHADEALILGVLGPNPLEHDVALEAFNAVGPPDEDVRHSSRRQVLEHHVATQTRLHPRQGMKL